MDRTAEASINPAAESGAPAHNTNNDGRTRVFIPKRKIHSSSEESVHVVPLAPEAPKTENESSKTDSVPDTQDSPQADAVSDTQNSPQADTVSDTQDSPKTDTVSDTQARAESAARAMVDRALQREAAEKSAAESADKPAAETDKNPAAEPAADATAGAASPDTADAPADDTAPLNPTGADTADTADASAAPAPSPAAKAPRFCIKCGAPLKPGAKFCTKCGHRIGERLK